MLDFDELFADGAAGRAKLLHSCSGSQETQSSACLQMPSVQFHYLRSLLSSSADEASAGTFLMYGLGFRV